MSSDTGQRPSLVRRMAAMLWFAAVLAYVTTLVSMVAGANYLIERNLDQQARQLLPVFDDLSAQVLLSPESSARSRISSYASRIPDIGLVRVYDKRALAVLAEYRKPGGPHFPRLDARRAALMAASGSTVTDVDRLLGVGRAIQAFAPVRQVVQRSELLDFGVTPQQETSETVGYIEIGMDFAPSRNSVYAAALVTLGVLSLVLFAALSAIISRMRSALRPLHSLQDALARIAEGDFDASVGDGPADREVATIRDAIGTTIVALRQREAERNEAVRAKVLADESNLAKGTFLANMSHEIRTPMNGVIGMLELLLGTGLTDTQRKFAGVAHSSAESLLSLINDILDFSKIEAGKLDLEAIPFDLLHELENVASAQALAAQEKGLELVVNYPSSLPHMLVGDPVRVRQVVANMVSNAIKFTRAGHVLVDVREVSRGAQCCRLRIAVTDTGIGLASDQLESIFDKFTQADASTTRRYGGTGLGLSICKLLVEMMKGTIGASSEPGKGSTFWCELDLGLANGAEPVAEAGALAGLRVLCVDSHDAQSAVRIEHLAQHGIVAERVASGAAAMQALAGAALAGRPYSVALVDHHLHDIDAELLGERIKAYRDCASTQLVVISSLSDAATGERYARAGYSAFLSKPVAQQTLIDTLRALNASLAIGIALPFMHFGSPAGGPGVDDAGVVDDHVLAGCTILAVDDNPVNLQVVSHMLERLGAQVDVAENGRIAVHMFLARQYSLILMDCQMPELDGYQAVGEIRHLEGAMQATAGGQGRIPVIALTAHALAGEREKCLEAGMDDFLTKPLRAAELRDKLLAWLRPGVAVTAPVDAPAPAQDPVAEARAMFGAKFPKFAQLFLADAPRRVAVLTQAVGRHDAGQVSELAHALAGSAAAMGALALSEQCRALELAARAGDLAGAGQKCAEIADEYDKIDARLRAMMAAAS
ncbi:response regulator [Massilia sp. PAMC28688]|uniref:hybrid sensor histidine kinase/response regulator n=1 Tax=Massilia sp. PAMC28688 TaxID=2861283 RepID=UPI001C636977|nr:hybrid sensor histidine kinase/response regulator [Massilia sp. PAMC28688]QYF92162.1 response regulator [Massilia sp. PAMC28688]